MVCWIREGNDLKKEKNIDLIQGEEWLYKITSIYIYMCVCVCVVVPMTQGLIL